MNTYYLIDKDTNTTIFRVTPKENYPPYNKLVEIYNYKENKFIETIRLRGEIINPDYREIKEEEVPRYIEKARKRIKIIV